MSEWSILFPAVTNQIIQINILIIVIMIADVALEFLQNVLQ